jgi:hypothetical protein
MENDKKEIVGETRYPTLEFSGNDKRGEFTLVSEVTNNPENITAVEIIINSVSEDIKREILRIWESSKTGSIPDRNDMVHYRFLYEDFEYIEPTTL